MNQSELVDNVAQKTTLTQTAATEAVKAVVQAVLECLVAGEPVRVSGLGTFNVAARPARDGRNPQTGESIKNSGQQGSAVPRREDRQRCPQPTKKRWQ
jgi:DNA-binding protein HU-beta